MHFEDMSMEAEVKSFHILTFPLTAAQEEQRTFF